MGVCLEVQFTPLEFEGSVIPLSSVLDFLEEFGRHYGNVGSVTRRASTLMCRFMMMER